MVVPAYYVADDDVLAKLRAYAHAGGHLVLTMRTGYADTECVARQTVMPGVFRSDAGFSYLEFSNLAAPVPVTGALHGAATGWADGIAAEGADVLATYEHPHFGRYAAVTTQAIGDGRITYVGTNPDRALSASLFSWIADASGITDVWRDAMSSTTHVTHATNEAGEALVFLHNWAWDASTVIAPVTCRDLTTGDVVPAGSPMTLHSWDARILVVA